MVILDAEGCHITSVQNSVLIHPRPIFMEEVVVDYFSTVFIFFFRTLKLLLMANFWNFCILWDGQLQLVSIQDGLVT